MVTFKPFPTVWFKRNSKKKSENKEKGVVKMSKQSKVIKDIREKVRKIEGEVIQGYDDKNTLLQNNSVEVLNKLEAITKKTYEDKLLMISEQDNLKREEEKLNGQQDELAEQLVVAEIEGDNQLVTETENQLSVLIGKSEALKVKGHAYERLSKAPMKARERKKVAKLYTEYEEKVINTSLYDDYELILNDLNSLIEQLQGFSAELKERVPNTDRRGIIKRRQLASFGNPLNVGNSYVERAFKKYGLKSFNKGHDNKYLFMYVERWLNSDDELNFEDFVDKYISEAVQEGKEKEINSNQLDQL